jgi:hypothetical protein
VKCQAWLVRASLTVGARSRCAEYQRVRLAARDGGATGSVLPVALASGRRWAGLGESAQADLLAARPLAANLFADCYYSPNGWVVAIQTGGPTHVDRARTFASQRCRLELARTNPVYEDIATKFFEHFLFIAGAMHDIAGEGIQLWDDQDEFFYDALHLPNGAHVPLRVRSLVGLIPLLAVETVEPAVLDALPGFKTRLEWFLTHRSDLASLVSRWHEPGAGERRLLALVRGHRMKRLLKRMLDPDEFLSPYGVRSLSKYHEANPYTLQMNGSIYTVGYEAAESRSGLFGGNSNWRGPVWFPINYLLIESLQKFHRYYGDDFTVECPTDSGQYLTLDTIADELSHRLIALFLRNDQGRRPFNGGTELLQSDPHWRDYLFFHEYFHGDNGAGLGASHQTGWTGLVAKLIQQQGTKHHTIEP